MGDKVYVKYYAFFEYGLFNLFIKLPLSWTNIREPAKGLHSGVISSPLMYNKMDLKGTAIIDDI